MPLDAEDGSGIEAWPGPPASPVGHEGSIRQRPDAVFLHALFTRPEIQILVRLRRFEATRTTDSETRPILAHLSSSSPSDTSKIAMK